MDMRVNILILLELFVGCLYILIVFLILLFIGYLVKILKEDLKRFVVGKGKEMRNGMIVWFSDIVS